MWKQWPNILIVIGIVLFVLGASGYGLRRPGFIEIGAPQRDAYFSPIERTEMAAGAALITVGLLGRRRRQT